MVKNKTQIVTKNGFSKKILDNLPQGIDIVDKNANIIYMNNFLIKKFGKKSIGKKCYEVYKKDKKQCFNCPLKKSIKIGQSKTIEVKGAIDEKIFLIVHKGVEFEGKKAVLEIFQDVTKQKQVEKKLKESEEKFRLIYETSPDAIMTLEPPSWKFTSGNKAIVKMFGVKDENHFTTLGPWQLSPKYQPDGQLSSVKAKKMINKAMKEGGNFFEWTHKKFKGENFFATVLLNKVNFRGKAFLNARVQDITEQKRSEENLRMTEYSINKSSDAIFWIDKDAGFIKANSAGSKLLGYTKSELSKMKVYDIDPIFTKEVWPKHWQELKKKKSMTIQTKHIKKDGTIYDAEIFLNYIKYGDQEYNFAFVTDITKQKKAEKELEESEERLETILNSMSDGLFVIDKENKILMFNKTASDISMFSYEEVFGKNYNKFIKFVFEDTDKLNDLFIKESLLFGRTTKMTNHSELIRKNGTRIPISTNATSFKDSNGDIIGCVVLFRDITYEREVDKMKSEFISVASHQLKTPLTGIKWFSELLLKEKGGDLNKKQKYFLTNVHYSNERLINLVDDLLDTSHIEAGKKFEIHRKETDIVEIVNDVIKNKISLISNKKITVIKCEGAPKEFKLSVDPIKIKQVFNNLVNNALKYSKYGGQVEIGCDQHLKNKIIIYVKDKGIGIPKKQQNRVFDKFFRADNAITSKTDGTGLGLYIAKAIIEAHGGEMWFESKIGKGSTFYFSLPID